MYATVNHLINKVSWGNVYVVDTIGKYLIAAVIFYSNILFILPFTFKQKKYHQLVLLLIVLTFVSFGIKEVLYKKVFVFWGYPHPPYTLVESYIMNIWWWFQYTLFAFGYWIANELIDKEREKTKLEKERLHLEYAYLKSQINPHFLYNVLNWFYAKSLGASEQLSNGVLYLAEIMGYIIKHEKDQDKEGKISLDKEIKQIENIIQINQLRFDNKLNVLFSKEGDFENIRVIPFVFITLVENAFKHGRLSDNGHPIIISITHSTSNKTIALFVKNQKTNHSSEYSTGIGLENIRRRLNLDYKGRHSISVVEDSNNYAVTLTINL
jgi:hypothetical protein